MNAHSSIYFKVTAALIRKGERLFIARRPPEKRFGLLWEFPGGKVEPGEDLEASLIREIREELCWEIEVKELFQRIHYDYADFSIELNAFWCVVRGGQLCLREHTAYRWVRVDELGDYSFTRADRQLISLLERVPLPVYGMDPEPDLF